jgi:hypothetical protein
VELRFPLKGIERSTAYHKQPQETTPTAINVRAYDSGTNRARGGSRAGLTPFFGAGSTAQVSGLNFIQSLSCIVTADSNAIG